MAIVLAVKVEAQEVTLVRAYGGCAERGGQVDLGHVEASAHGSRQLQSVVEFGVTDCRRGNSVVEGVSDGPEWL